MFGGAWHCWECQGGCFEIILGYVWTRWHPLQTLCIARALSEGIEGVLSKPHPLHRVSSGHRFKCTGALSPVCSLLPIFCFASGIRLSTMLRKLYSESVQAPCSGCWLQWPFGLAYPFPVPATPVELHPGFLHARGWKGPPNAQVSLSGTKGRDRGWHLDMEHAHVHPAGIAHCPLSESPFELVS